MNKKVGLISILAVLVLLGGFMIFKGGNSEDSSNGDKKTISVEHALGTTEVPVNPERVVVFDYAILDAIDALGIEGVVGVPQSSSIPDYLSKYKGEEYTNVGGLKEPDLEAINSLKPDLIIINGRQHSFNEQLSAIAPTISMSKEDGKYVEDVTHNMEVIGQIFGKEKEVKEELGKINDKIADINAKVTEKGYNATTLMVSSGKLSVFGAESRFGLIYTDLGFKNTDGNIEAANHGQDVSFEYVASQDSDYIFVVDKSVIMTDSNEKPAQEILDNELINNTRAAKDGNIIYLNTSAWYLSDGGLTSTNIMLDEVNEAVSK